MTFEPIIAALVTNLITKFVKPSKLGMTAEQQESRKTLVRVINAGLALVGIVALTLLTGAEVDATAVQTSVDIIVNAGMAFAMSQGVYFLSK